MSQAQVTITRRGAERVRGGHLWVYRSDVRDAADAAGGATARVRDERGRFVAHALYSDRSEIALRVLTTKDEAVGREWWRARLRAAAGRRAGLEREQHGVRFRVAPLGGQKTGAFLDQRENHLAARAYARGRALDCFTFNGGFALSIAPACESVLGLDISPEAVAAARRNAELNGAANVNFGEANVFDALHELEAAGERFQTIVLDPPAFARNRASVPAAARGYKEINLRALKLLEAGGVLVTCTCSYHMTESLFLELLAEAAAD